MKRTWIDAIVISAALLGSAGAKEVTLRGYSAFTEGTQFSKNFERFIERVNSTGKGVIQINYIGGPRSLPPFEVGNAIRNRVIDIANTPGAFYTNVMPEADATKLIQAPMSEQRKNGTWAYINELHNKRVNAWYLTRQFHNVPFNIFLNRKIDKPDLTGLKIRVTPIYRDMVATLGGTPVTMAPGEVSTALERGGGGRLRMARDRHFRSWLGEGDQVPARSAVLQRRS